MTDKSIDDIDPAVLDDPAALRELTDFLGRERAETLLGMGGLADLQEVAAVLVASARVCREIGIKMGADDKDVAAMFGHLVWAMSEQLFFGAVLKQTAIPHGKAN